MEQAAQLTNVHCGMASESYCHGTSRSFEMNKRNILLSAKASWIHLDEDSLTPTIVDNPPPDSQLEDSKEENIRHWLDSGFFSSTSEDLQDREKAVSLVIPGMVQMTVQSYMRSLHQFSETPVMSRWNSFNSSQSLSSAPKSITEWLKLWEKDPVEILLDLGFGTEEPDICTKIPSRFISNASVAKGINIRVFLEAQKQRMDIENPNLYGRFRQLEVLDQVTSAFSSLLNGVNTQQQKPEESSGEEKSMMDIQRNKAKATRAKQRRLGQLLRKASRQATVCQRSPQTSGILVSFKDREEPSPTSAETDRCRTIRTCFSENNTLVGLAEEQSSTEDGALTLSQLPQAPIGKSQFLSYMPIEQPQLSSASERVVKDRPRKESNLLLTNMLRRVSALKGKPPDSFEMEEIQSFEDETPWGNPRDSTSEVLMTRTNSCQSDSSGFLEEPLEPFPLQNPPFPGNLNLGCDTHDRKSALPQRTALVASHRDFYQKPKSPVAYTSTADCKNLPSVPSPDREQDQREEIILPLTVEDSLHQTISDESENVVKEMVYGVNNKQEIKTGRGQLEKEESCIQQDTPCFQNDNQDVGDINTPELDCHLYCSSIPKSTAPAHAQDNGTTPIDFTDSGACAKNEESEGPLTEDDKRKVLKENIQEDITGSVKGKRCNMEFFSKADTVVPVTKATSVQQFFKLDFDIKCVSHSSEAETPATQWQVFQVENESKVISSSSIPASNLAAHCSEGRSEFSSQESTETCLDKISGDKKLVKDDSVQNTEIYTNPSKSVTVQMSSRLMSTGQKVSLSEGLSKDPFSEIKSIMSQCFEDEPVITSELDTLKEGLRETREASIQTDTIEMKTRNRWPDPQLLPPFYRHGHLTKSVSLDTGLYGKYRSSYCEVFGAWSAQCGHSCHCFCCHHCCHCSNPAAIELQLLKMLELLQDTALRTITPCTIHEIEVMKRSCQSFREKLDEIEQHLVEQQNLFSSAMSDEGREEKRQLQVLRQAVRREVSELEYQLNDRSRQVREGILMQLDQLLGEQSHLFSELGLPDCREERTAQNKQVVPDTADTMNSRAGSSKIVFPRVLRRSEMLPSTPSASMDRTPEMQFLAIATAEPDLRELLTGKKEIKGPPQPKIDFKAFLQSLKKYFRNSFSNDTEE
nr:coiled-coil domain-containing protein 129 [Pelodiscus sinensis]|eukprot:XP_006124089.1 coiled-coil domain-containing protein 129 [Pelodiscus sinensis]